MVMLRKMRALVLLFALVVLFIGAFSIMSADTAQAKRCCWVMVCTVNRAWAIKLSSVDCRK